MAIVNDEQLRALLAEIRIATISFDKKVFEQKRLQLNSATIQAFARLRSRPFSFVLSATVAKEVLAQLEKAAAETL